MALLLALGAVGCTGALPKESTSSVELSGAGDPIPRIDRSQSVGPEGARVDAVVTVDVPTGVVPAGQRFTVGVGQPIGQVSGSREEFGAPVQVEHAVDLLAPVRISWDVSHLSPEQRASLLLVRWDPELGVWRVANEKAVLMGTTLSAEVTQFSFVNWVSGGAASISQTVGQWTGKRADAPSCSGAALPAWVTNVVRPDAEQPAMPIRTCAEPDNNDVLTVRVANNRPYTQVLDLTQGDRYAWTWAGEADYTPAGIIRDATNGLMSGDKTLVMAPARATAVGLARPATPGQVRLTMTARPEVATVATDILVYLLENGLGVDNVGGFDSEALNTFVQSVYDCGGKQVLKSRDLVGGDTFQKVLETVKSCVDSDGVRTAIEDVLRTQVAKGGDAAAQAMRTNRILHEAMGKLGLYLTVSDFSSYVAELSSAGQIGDVTVNVFGTGQVQTLGSWKPSCKSADADSTALYRNLALQDAFKDTGKEYWQFPSWQSSSVTAAQPLAACNAAHIEAVAGNVEATWADKKAAAVVAQSIRALIKGTEATRVTTINILSGGQLKPGYTVKAETNTVEDCTYDQGSPAGMTANTHSCGTVAAYMPACWADPSRANTLLCLSHGWDTTVRRIPVTGLHPTPKVADPIPLSVELTDGSRWFLRIGGAWDAVPDGYYASYGCLEKCDGHANQVLVASESGRTFDTSKATWTALIAKTGRDPRALPRPTTTPVAQVWFIAAS